MQQMLVDFVSVILYSLS